MKYSQLKIRKRKRFQKEVDILAEQLMKKLNYHSWNLVREYSTECYKIAEKYLDKGEQNKPIAEHLSSSRSKK